MPEIGFYHPLIVHFAVALTIVGVGFRWTGLVGRVRFAGPAAAALLLLAMAAAVAAAWSGMDAGVPAEAVPGTAILVAEHAAWGLRTRNLLLIIGGIEILALLLTQVGRDARLALLASGVFGLVALACVVETGERGGELVYAHAAGVGIRSGDPDDVGRLLLAGLYHQADLDERAGRPEEAADLTELAARRFPSDPAIQLLAAQSLIEDRHDPTTALTVLGAVPATPDPRLRFRRLWLTADALEALGQIDATRTTLVGMRAEFPDSDRLRRRIDRLSTSVATRAAPE